MDKFKDLKLYELYKLLFIFRKTLIIFIISKSINLINNLFMGLINIIKI